jgi:glycosyltransferase involved in cell wall biosynthesis
MRTCHVVYAHFPEDPRVRREVDVLCKAGHEVDVVCLQSEKEPRKETVNGVRIVRVPLRVRRGGRIRYLYQYVLFFVVSTILLALGHLRRRYEIVHVHSLPDFQILAALVPRITGAKTILDLHEAFPEIVAARFRLSMRSPLVVLASIGERLSVWFADRVVTVNDTIRDLLVARCHAVDKIVVVMNSPDLRVMKVGDVEGLRANLGLAGHPAFVYVGGINPERDLETILRATASLSAQIPLHLVIAGYGEPSYVDSIRRLTVDLGLNGRTHFLSRIPQDQVLTYLSLSEFGVVSYEDNPLTRVAIPTKAFEYAATGKPMAISNLPALKALFNQAAEFFHPGDADSLAEAIQRLLRDGVSAALLTEKARDVLGSCSWELMSHRLLALYRTLGGI